MIFTQDEELFILELKWQELFERGEVEADLNFLIEYLGEPMPFRYFEPSYVYAPKYPVTYLPPGILKKD